MRVVSPIRISAPSEGVLGGWISALAPLPRRRSQRLLRQCPELSQVHRLQLTDFGALPPYETSLSQDPYFGGLRRDESTRH